MSLPPATAQPPLVAALPPGAVTVAQRFKHHHPTKLRSAFVVRDAGGDLLEDHDLVLLDTKLVLTSSHGVVVTEDEASPDPVAPLTVAPVEVAVEAVPATFDDDTETDSAVDVEIAAITTHALVLVNMLANLEASLSSTQPASLADVGIGLTPREVKLVEDQAVCLAMLLEAIDTVREGGTLITGDEAIVIIRDLVDILPDSETVGSLAHLLHRITAESAGLENPVELGDPMIQAA
jgi:hypothetical protein